MKLLNSTIKLIMIAVVVSIVSMMTTFMMFNIYSDKILQQFDLGFQHTDVSMNELMSEMTGQRSLDQQSQMDVPGDMQATVEQAESEIEQTESVVEQVEPEVVDVWNQQADSQLEQEIQIEQQLVSVDDFNRLRDQLSDEDKMKVFSLAISNIPPQQIHAFSHILENGITEQELQDLDEMLQQYLDTDDYLDLMSIISKYE